jgi:hypothetical protein
MVTKSSPINDLKNDLKTTPSANSHKLPNLGGCWNLVILIYWEFIKQMCRHTFWLSG